MRMFFRPFEDRIYICSFSIWHPKASYITVCYYSFHFQPWNELIFCVSGSDNNIAEEDIGAGAEDGNDNNNNNVPRGINRLSREYP